MATGLLRDGTRIGGRRVDLRGGHVVAVVAGLVVVLGLLAVVDRTGDRASDASSGTPAAPPVRRTLFGSSASPSPGVSRAESMARLDQSFGRLPVARVFFPGLPDPWSDLSRDLGDRPLVVSFRSTPAEVLAGATDQYLSTWFRSAPTDRDTYWTYFHEPEGAVGEGRFAISDFVAAWSHVARLAAAAGNPRLKATVVLMCWSAQPASGRDWRAYVPDDGTVDVLAWDCYAHGDSASTYVDPAALLGPTRGASAAASADWAIAELGARTAPGADGADRARWLQEVGAYAQGFDARFVTYFDTTKGGDFRLLDEPSIGAWADLVQSSYRDRVPAGEDS